MTRYRAVHCLIWNDDKFPFASDECQLVFFHILTTPLSSPFGLYKASVEALAAEKRWDVKAYRKAFDEVFQAGFVKYDERSQVILIPRFLKYNPPNNPNVLIGWASIFAEIPSSPLKDEFYQYLKDFTKGYKKGFHEAFRKAWPQPLPIQDQDQDQDQDQEKEVKHMSPRSRSPTQQSAAAEPRYSPGFTEWWETYPNDRRVSKAQCYAVWERYHLEARAEELVAKLVRLLETTWKESERQYIKTSLPYLNSKRYDDDLMPLPETLPVRAVRLTYAEEAEARRKAKNADMNQQLEELALGINSHNSVWGDLGHARQSVPRDVGPRLQRRLPAGHE